MMKNNDEQGKKCESKFLKKRYIILTMCMMMNALSYTMRTNLNMTMVAMVKDDQPSPASFRTNDSICPSSSIILEPDLIKIDDYDGDDTEGNFRGVFDWNEALQGSIIGAYYYGYIFTNLNGGQMSEWWGTKRLLAVAMALSAILTLIVPVSAFCHPWLLFAVRVLTGLAQGVVTPAIYQLLSYWTPRAELGISFGLIPASGFLGATITMPVCAFLSELNFLGGWPSVFYVFGAIGLISLIPWWLLVENSPDVHPTISNSELRYIQNNSTTSQAKQGAEKSSYVPWCSILKSRKIWAITTCRFCCTWGNLFLMSKLPTYLSQVLNMPITYNGYVNASVYISLGASMLFSGSIADWVERRKWFTRTLSRKIFQSIAMFGAAAFLSAVPLAGCNILIIVIMINLSMLILGLTAGGDSLIIVDVAPDYSGSIYGFTNSLGSLPGFLAPLFVGIMLDMPGTDLMIQWQRLFFIAAAIYVFGAIIFLIFVDSKPEPWGHLSSSELELETETNHPPPPSQPSASSSSSIS